MTPKEMDSSLKFMGAKHEISCRIINTVIEYTRQQGKDASVLFEELPYDERYLTDTNNWISREEDEQLCQRLKDMFDDDTIMYKVGFASEKLRTLGFVDFVVRLMGDPKFAIKQTPALVKYFDRHVELAVEKFGPLGATVKFFPKTGCSIRADNCYYLKGTLAALPTVWKVGRGKIWEETCSVPIDKKGRLNGKFYTINDAQEVLEHDVESERQGKDEPKIIGSLESDGTFSLDGTVYGAMSCRYHISWPVHKMIIQRIHYELFTKPKLLTETIEEMFQENDLIQQKYEELYQNNSKLQKTYIDTISALIRAIDTNDHYAEDHSLKVARIAKELATQLHLSSKKIETILRACQLHDLGKIGVKESTLLKPGKLNEEEWEEIKKHPVLGAEIIKPLVFLSDVAVLIREDHERWDGDGYPDGLQGEQIDIGARIIMVSDAFDAMTSDRPYRKAMTKEKAIEEIKRNSGTQFDPTVVEAFLKVQSKL